LRRVAGGLVIGNKLEHVPKLEPQPASVNVGFFLVEMPANFRKPCPNKYENTFDSGSLAFVACFNPRRNANRHPALARRRSRRARHEVE
jgi:hypothetical protein